MTWSQFWVEVKEAVLRLLIKLLYTLQSRKFWAFFFGCVVIIQKWSQGVLDPEVAVWSLVSAIIAYSGLVAAEDIAARKS